MGFRSTFTTEDYGIQWPQWFRDEYSDYIWFRPSGSGALHSKMEAKLYPAWFDLIEDIATSLEETGWWDGGGVNFVLVFLHECGGITRVQFDENRVSYSEPEEWKAVEQPTHSYCYDCSDVENIGWKQREANKRPTIYDSETCRPYIDPVTGKSTERKKT